MTETLDSSDDVTIALTRVGQLLADESRSFSIVIVGGAALLLLGVSSRATTDVDVIAMSSTGPGGRKLERPDKTLPQALARAAEIVARDQGLSPNWLNTEVAAQWNTGFPPDMAGRITWRQLGALEIGVIARLDLIFFKLYAVTGTTKPTEKHYQDLIKLAPSQEELAAARSWVATQGAGDGFDYELQQLIENARRDLGHSSR